MYLANPLAQLDALAQVDLDGWVDLLILVVIAVFYALGGLVKAARRKPQQAQRQAPSQGPPRPRETWQQRLVRKAQEIQRAAEARERQAAERIQQYRREQEAAANAARERQAAQQQNARHAVATARQQVTARSPTRPRIDLREPAEQLDTVVLEAAEPAAAHKERLSPSRTHGYGPTSVIDPGDPDALKKAVLHYAVSYTHLRAHET